MTQKYASLLLAKHPCSQKTVEQGQTLRCRDIYRSVVTDGRGKIVSIKCLHGHESRGKERELANK